ncbi:MAG: alpha-hydroxy-acid oxidizing protein [Acidobacteria bacterium]|nr:alpha-hydroxy-acid oxidizing protein [Acidobacteriota bacterium]
MPIDRRAAIRRLVQFVAGSPLVAAAARGQNPSTVYPPSYSDEVMGPVNLHEFEPIAKAKLHKLAYDFIAGGVEDEVTLRANRDGFECLRLVPRVMTDVSKVDPSVQLLGKKLPAPILLAPTGGKNLIVPGADLVCARAAAHVGTIYSVGGAPMDRLEDEGVELTWWSNTIGTPDRESAQNYAARVEDDGAGAILLTVDNQYQSNRDRNNRNRFDYGYMSSGVPQAKQGQPPRSPAIAAMWQRHTPNLTWEWMNWVRSRSKLPIVVKGVLDPMDAELAVENGAAAVVVSNHGARQLDSVMASIDALPDIVQAVGGKVPILLDGGVRRGTDVVKALALGATAVQIGRPYLWGMAAFGQEGVQRVWELLAAEFKLSLALAGKANVHDLDKRMVRNPQCGL